MTTDARLDTGEAVKLVGQPWTFGQKMFQSCLHRDGKVRAHDADRVLVDAPIVMTPAPARKLGRRPRRMKGVRGW